MDLLLQLLVLRPDKRIGAAEALRHPYFTKYQPSPCDPSELALPIPEERKNKVSCCSYRKEDAFLEVQPEYLMNGGVLYLLKTELSQRMFGILRIPYRALMTRLCWGALLTIPGMKASMKLKPHEHSFL